MDQQLPWETPLIAFILSTMVGRVIAVDIIRTEISK